MLGSLAAAYAQSPRRVGPLGGPALYGVSGVPGDGPYVEVWALVEGGVVVRAAHRTPGCPSSTAAAEALCALAEGREAARVASLTAADLQAVLGGLPDGKGHWAGMAVEAMRTALQAARGEE